MLFYTKEVITFRKLKQYSTLESEPILGDKGFDEPSSNEWSNNICQADKSEIGKGIR